MSKFLLKKGGKGKCNKSQAGLITSVSRKMRNSGSSYLAGKETTHCLVVPCGQRSCPGMGIISF